MPVTKTQEWATPITGSAEPSGTVTIGGGGNRTLLFVQGIENDGTATTSVGIGNVAATGNGSIFLDNGGQDLQINYWYWNESDLGSMSGNTIDYTELPVLNKQAWTYATFSSCEQTAPVVVTSAGGLSVSNSLGLGIATVGNSADYVAIVGMRDTQNRQFGAFGSLTEIYDAAIGADARFGVGDGGWYANSVTVTGDSVIQDAMALAGFVFKALSGAGSGDIIAPVALVSASGTTGVNDLKPANRTMAGVGERSIVWQGAVALTAPEPTASNVSLQFGGSGDIDPPLFFVEGIGARQIDISGDMSPSIVTVASSAERAVTGSGAMSPSSLTMTSDTGFDALWYVSKEVYF